MKTRLKNFARVNYPVDYELDPLSTMRTLQLKCQRGEINAIKEGRLWFVIDDGTFKRKQKTGNPLIA